MEDLTKHQTILLVLLVSFVTSIATGIMTVSLLQQAPVEITRNINSIVEKTIETVTPASISNSISKSSGKDTTTTTTVVVKEDDLIVASINKNIKSVARISDIDRLSGESTFYGIGLVVNKDGTIMGVRRSIDLEHMYTAKLSDGTEITLAPQGLDKKSNFILFKIVQPEKAKKTDFIPVSFAASDAQLGQTLISLGGDTSNAVSVGRVLSLVTKDSTVASSTVKSIVGIDTDVSSRDIVLGSPLFNLSGDVVGLKLSLETQKQFIPVSLLKRELANLTE
ncbi:MAG: trypsin-like peptidase domain-containing protein [Patescibacteria group bacterium]